MLVGETCKADYPLEFFITTKERAYKSALVIDERHAGGNVGLSEHSGGPHPLRRESGHPSYYTRRQEDHVASGDEITIEVRWKNKEGKIEHTDARNWIRDMKTKKPPVKNWVFAGSRLVTDEKAENFHGQRGEFVCVLNNPRAMLDLPRRQRRGDRRPFVRGQQRKAAAAGTPVTIVLIPKVQPKAERRAARRNRTAKLK